MPRIVYVNGEYLPESDAKISIFDRGFLFGDGIYEVTLVIDGKMIDLAPHLARLRRSLTEIAMDCPLGDDDVRALFKTLIARNQLTEGGIYLQISRGAADRDFPFPAGVTPSVVAFTQARGVVDAAKAKKGLSVCILPDIRWKRRDIKTVNLLGACMAKTEALARGFDDAWMAEDGYITEGSSNNAWIVTHDGALVTRQLGPELLAGVTRRAVMRLAAEHGLRIEERAFTAEEAQDAAEAFVTSATMLVTGVVKIDDRHLSNGAPGPMTQKLRALYIEMARAEGE